MTSPDPPAPGPLRRPLFGAGTTHAVRVALLGVGLTVGAAGFTTYEYYHSPYWDRVGVAPAQPVPFSHRHHAGELRLDCRFCHPTVETAAEAGMPSTQTCLTCHSQLFRGEPMLQPVMASAADNVPLAWSRVNTLPDHVHFDHSIHVAKGIACASCHGDVADMPLMRKARALTMRECLACHRDPGPHQVAAAEVFRPSGPGLLTSSATSGEGSGRGNEAVPRPLTNCSTCHH
ncbi:MAG TPA: hypothetical protein VG838_16540 [Opitutaceae bacterium]|nr:hypothetical protein [Opitutaceae bacterium]